MWKLHIIRIYEGEVKYTTIKDRKRELCSVGKETAALSMRIIALNR
jgi:hypothetical protein